MLFLHHRILDVLRDESGQDLVEYAFLGVLIALGAVASMRSVASGILAVFTQLGTTLTTAV